SGLSGNAPLDGRFTLTCPHLVASRSFQRVREVVTKSESQPKLNQLLTISTFLYSSASDTLVSVRILHANKRIGGKQSKASRRKEIVMRISHRLAKPLSEEIAILVGTGILILGLLTLSLLLTRTSHAAFASANTLHPFTITSPNFRDGAPLSQR